MRGFLTADYIKSVVHDLRTVCCTSRSAVDVQSLVHDMVQLCTVCCTSRGAVDVQSVVHDLVLLMCSLLYIALGKLS